MLAGEQQINTGAIVVGLLCRVDWLRRPSRHSPAPTSFAQDASMPPGGPGKAIHTITGDSSVAKVDLSGYPTPYTIPNPQPGRVP